MPACSDAWVVGATLPEGYEGCMDGGTMVAAISIECTDGSLFTTYDDRFHAVIGGEVFSSEDPDVYAKAYNDCTAD